MNRFKSSSILAVISFGIGTILFISQLIIGKFSNLLFIGYIYVIIAIIINLLAVIALVFSFAKNYNKKDALRCFGVILINIPIAYLYFLIIIQLF
ncbi:hypothetical protein [uncultured Algibacter sp.]|uniref:hypothetical protein n=1 Tax=uncultured Algibacter sp. TaxID=298659 RepID=UPI003217AC29